MDLPTRIDHVMVTAGGPHYVRLLDIDFEQARLSISEHLLLALWVARNAARKAKDYKLDLPADVIRFLDERLAHVLSLPCDVR